MSRIVSGATATTEVTTEETPRRICAMSTPDERLRAVGSSFPSRTPRSSLAAVDRLREAAGLPVPERAVAVVGTNGKTSTATYVERLLRRAGVSTGLTVSPHLRRWGERVLVDGRPVEDEELAADVEALDELVVERQELRFFDLVTLAAARIFSRRGVAVAIFEAGIGGGPGATAGGWAGGGASRWRSSKRASAGAWTQRRCFGRRSSR